MIVSRPRYVFHPSVSWERSGWDLEIRSSPRPPPSAAEAAAKNLKRARREQRRLAGAVEANRI